MEEDGPRVTKLCKALEKAVGLSSKPLPKSEFLKCFPFAHGNAKYIQILSVVYEEMHAQLLARVQSTITTVCQEQRISERLNQLDQLILEDKTCSELGIEQTAQRQESPLVEVQQTAMEIKRQELKWLQNSLKLEKQRGDELQTQLKSKQSLLAAILEKLHFQYETFLEATKTFRELECGEV